MLYICTLYIYIICALYHALSHSSHSKLHLLTFIFMGITLCFSEVAPANQPSSMYALCEFSVHCTSMTLTIRTHTDPDPALCPANQKFLHNCDCFTRTCMLGACSCTIMFTTILSFCVCTFSVSIYYSQDDITQLCILQ